MRRIAIIVALLAGPSATVHAQDTRPTESRTELTFEDADEVRGATVGAEGERLLVRRGRHVGSLIQPRTQFVHEMLKSVENM